MKTLYSSLIVLLCLGLVCSGCADPEKEVPILIKQLKDKDSSVRNQAALRLGSFGEDAKKAVPALSALLRDDNGGVRTSAAFALRKIGTPAALKAVDSYQK